MIVKQIYLVRDDEQAVIYLFFRSCTVFLEVIVHKADGHQRIRA